MKKNIKKDKDAQKIKILRGDEQAPPGVLPARQRFISVLDQDFAAMNRIRKETGWRQYEIINYALGALTDKWLAALHRNK